MSAIDTDGRPESRAGSRAGLGITDLPEAVGPVLDRVGERARAVDQSAADLWSCLRELGELDLLTAPLPVAAELTFALARRCTASAFSLWGHRSGVAYHEAAGAPLPDGAAAGTTPLASGMAPAFKEEAGLGEVPYVATPAADGGFSVSDFLPWCSNLGPGGWVITPVRTEAGDRAIIRFRTDAPGVEVRPLTGLTALDGTASGMVRLTDLQVPEEDVLTRDVPALLDRVRPVFLQIQSAMCLGLAAAALDAADGAVDPQSRAVLGDEFDEAATTWLRLRDRLADSVRTAVEDPSALRPIDLVRVRLETALLAGGATRLEQKVVGGRGYALASDTSRRAREAAFLPVQSPTETHLRILVDRAEQPSRDRG